MNKSLFKIIHFIDKKRLFLGILAFLAIFFIFLQSSDSLKAQVSQPPYFGTNIAPANGSNVPPLTADLSADVYDSEGDSLTAYFYVADSQTDLANSLICVDKGLLSVSQANCSFDAPVVQPDANTLFMSHFNYNSQLEGHTIITDHELKYNTSYTSFYVKDDAGNNYTPGTVLGEFGKFYQGQVGNALHFDANNDYVLVADNNSLDITNDITLEGWFKHRGGADCRMAFGNGGGWAQDAYQMLYLGNGQFRVELTNNSVGSMLFEPAHSYPREGTFLQSIAVGDFNEDGFNDFILPNYSPSQLFIFFNRGDGLFNSSEISGISDPFQVFDVLTGDFDNDGHLDLVVSGYNAGQIAVFGGNGNGTFQNPVYYTVSGGRLGKLAMGDFNNDGFLDFLVDNQIRARLYTFLNDGDGTFTYTSDFRYNGFPNFTVGRLDQDDNLDLIMNDGSLIRVYDGNGNGTFSYRTSHASQTGPVKVADLDQDNDNDLIVSNGQDNGVVIFLNDGNGNFFNHGEFVSSQAGGPYSFQNFALGDLDDDNNLDIVMGHNGSIISILLGDGQGNFTSEEVAYGAGNFPVNLVVSDFNNNSRLDLVVEDYNSGALVLLDNQDDSGYSLVLDSSATTANVWHQVVFSYDGDEAKFYLDGVEDTEKVYSGGMSASLIDLGVGYGLYPGYNCPASYPASFEGEMDEIKIYARGLSASEIERSYNLGLSGQTSDVSSDGLVLSLAFNETEGETTQDSSIQGNNSTLVNYTVPVYYEAEDGKLGGSMHFDGNSGYFWWPTEVKPIINNEEFSLGAWIKLDEDAFLNNDLAPIITDYHWYGDRSYQFNVLSDGNLYFMISEDGSAENASEIGDADTPHLTVKNKITDSEWHYVVATYKYLKDGMSKMRLYVDGELTSWTNIANGPVIIIPDRHPYVGYIGNSDNYFKGYIDEPMIYDYELNPAEVADNYSLKQGTYYWQAVVSDSASSTATDVMSFKLNNQPIISLNGLENGQLVETGQVDLGAMASDSDNDNLRTSIFVAASPEDLAKGQVCNAYDNDGSADLSCQVVELPLNQSDQDLVLYYKFDNDFYTGENYALGGHDLPFNTEPIGCYKIYNYAEGDYSIDDASDTRSTGIQDCYQNYNRQWVSGLVNEALSFDGSNDYIEVTDSDSLDLTGQFTIDFWFWPYKQDVSTSYYNQIFKKSRADGKANYEFRYASTSYFYVTDINGTQKYVSFSDDVFFVQEWNHVVALLDGTYLKVYVNGQQVGSSVAVTSSQIVPSTENLIIGNLLAGTSRYSRPFMGKIDEFHIYQRTLSGEEINQSFNDGLNNRSSTVSSTSQVLYLAFNQQDGDTAEDSSSYGQEATLKNYRYPQYEAGGGKFAGSLNFLGSSEGVVYDQLIWVNGWNANPEWALGGTGDLTNDMTVMTWVKPSGQSPITDDSIIYNRRFFYQPNNDHSDFGFINGENGALKLYFRVDDTSCKRTTAETFLGDFQSGDQDELISLERDNILNADELNQWHHVAATYHYNDQTSQGEMYLYIDGRPVARNLAAVGPLCKHTTMPMQIGGEWFRYWGYQGHPFYGSLDDTAVFKEALTAEQIASVYHNSWQGRHYYWQAAVYDGIDLVQSEIREFYLTGNPTVESAEVVPMTEYQCSNAHFPEFKAELSDPDLDDQPKGQFLITRVADPEGNPVVSESYIGMGSEADLSGGDLISHCGFDLPHEATCLNPVNLPENWQTGFPEGKYQFSVQAVDDYGAVSEWSEVMEFDIDWTAPEELKVEIQAIEGNRATLSLSVSDDHSDHLQIRLSGDLINDDPNKNVWQDFRPSIIVTLATGSGGKVVKAEFLDDCANTSNKSVGIGVAMPSVTIVSPKNAVFLPGDDLTFDDVDFIWQFTDEDLNDYQTAYQIELYSDVEALHKIYPLTETDWQSSSETTLTIQDLPLTTGTKYFWRIRVRDGYDLESDWSDLEAFYTNDRPTVTILAPKNNEHLTGDDSTYNDITFSWQFSDSDPGNYQAAYKIELYDQDREFVYETEWSESREKTIIIEDLPLATGAKYYWSLLVEDEYGLSGASELESFITNARPYGLEILVPGDEGEFVAYDPEIVFSQAIDPDNHDIFYQIAIKSSIEGEYETLLPWSQAEDYRDGDKYIFTGFSYEFYDGDYTIKICPQDEYGLTGDCAFSGFSLAFDRYNRWPVAIARFVDIIDPALIEVGDQIKFDGTNSYDSDGDEISYHWIIQERPAGSITAFNDYALSQPNLLIDSPGFYAIVLEVSDNHEPPAKSMRGLNCNYDDWLCFTVPQLGVAEYCGDGILQENEQCEKVYLDGQWQVVSDLPECGWNNCQKCLCGPGLNLPIWEEVMPR